MFLSNWLVFKIVLAAVTGLVDYPLAADVLLVYDNANKLYLEGNSIDYVSNVVLYKGETSYTLGMGDILNKTTTTAYEVALPANSVHATFGINQDATRYVHQYPVADGYQNGKFQVYSGTPSGGYTEYGSPITPFNGDEIINCAMSADGKYILVTTWNGGNDGYKMYKDNGSEYVYHSSYSFIGSKTTTGYNPAFVPSNNNFVITGTDDSSTWHFKLYVYNSATETWTAKVQVTPLGGSSSNYQRGSTGKGFTYDGNYFFQSSNGTTTRGEVWSVDWDANTMTYKWHTTEGSDGDGAGGAISPDNRYVVLCKHTGNPYRVYENMSGDWTTVENVTSQFDLTGSGTSTSFGSYGVGFSGYSSENTTPLYIGQAAGLYGDGKFRLENWAKRSPYEMYITQPGTYRADLQICGIDYKTNEVEVTGTPSDIEVFKEPETDFTANKAVLSSTSSPSYHQGGMSDNGEYYYYGQQVYKKDTGSFTYTAYGSALSTTIFGGSWSSISHDGNYIVSYYTNSTYQLHIIKNNGSTFVNHQTITSPNVSAQSQSQPQFISGPLKHFVWIEKVSGTSNITFHFYKYNSGTDTWSLGFSVTNPTDLSVGVRVYGRGGMSFSKDGNYLAISTGTGGTTETGVAVLKVDWVNETCVKKYENTSVGYWACFLSRDAKYFYYSTGTGTTAGKMLYSANGDWEGTPTDVTSSFTNIGNLGDHSSVFSDRYIFSEKGGSAIYIFKWQDLISPTLTFDNYNKLSLTNTPTYTSSKLTYGSNVYDIGTLTSDITIEKQGEYASLTFDTSSNVAYFSNVTVGAIASTMAGYEKQDQVLDAGTNAGYSNGDAAQGGYGNSIDMSADGTRMVVGNAHYTDSNGRVWLYHLESGSWVLKQTWDGGTRLGSQVAMNEAGTRVFAVSPQLDSQNLGFVRIWDYSSGAWDTSASGTYSISPGTINGEVSAVDCNKAGDVVIIGSGNSSNNTWIYRLSGGSWSSEKNFSRRGSGVSMNGDGTRCFMGDRSSHKVWESNYSGGSWGTETEIISESSFSGYWPASLSTDSAGETVCIKGGDSGNGAIYERAGNGSWSASVSGILSKTELYGTDKVALSYDGTMALFGHTRDSSGALSTGGHALLYTKSESTWTLTQTLLNPSSSQDSNDFFGGGTGLAKTVKDRFVVAAMGDDNAGTNYGAIYTYTNAIPDFISFDTYNKLSLSGITNPTSKLHALPTGAESTTTYDIGTATNIYIESAGTYTVAMKGSSAFALDSNVVGTVTPLPTDYVKIPDIPVDIYTDSSYIRTTTSYTNSIGQTVYPGVKSSFTYNGGAYEISADSCADGNTEGANYQPWHVFTSILGDTTYSYYNTANYVNVPSWLKIKIPSAKVAVGFFLLENRNEHINGFKIQGSNNDSDWTDLYTGTTVGMTTGISPTFSNSTAYQYYRLYVTSLSSSGNNYWRIDDWNMHFFGYVAAPSLNFDTYNKLTFTGADTDSTYKLKYESNTYDLGTISNVYIAYPGTYSAEIKGATNFALSSNVTGGTITPYKVWKENEDQILYGSDPGAGDHFGHAVAVDGNYAVVGSRYNDTGGTDRGAAFIFHKSGGTWTEQAMVQPSDTANDDWFGRGVAISGDYVIVNAYAKTTNNTGQGAAYIFYRSGTSWTQQAKLNASDGEAGDAYSYSVDIDGDYAIVGSLNEDPGGTSNAGSAYIYVRSGTSWSQQAKIQASDKEANDTFGRGVTISGDYAAVGADNEDTSGSNAGSVYIFKYDATTPPDDLPPVDSVGTGFNYKRYTALDTSTHYVYKMWRNSASDWRTPSPASANTIKVLKTDSTDWSDNDTTDTNPEYVDTTTYSGKVSLGQSAGPTENYRFSVPTFGSWSQQQKIQSDDIQADDYFGGGAGQGVSLSGDTLAVGARKEDTGGSEAGSVYIFKKASGSETWSQEAKLQASDVSADSQFGMSVSLSGDILAVGANQEDTIGTDAGAAYIFERSGTTWTEVKRITASDGQANDEFGTSISTDGTTTFVGAYGEDTKGGGAGAAYVYEKVNVLDFDGYNKLTFTGLESGSTSTLKYGSNTYDIGTASNVYISEQGTYEAESKGTTTFALTSNTALNVTEYSSTGLDTVIFSKISGSSWTANSTITDIQLKDANDNLLTIEYFYFPNSNGGNGRDLEYINSSSGTLFSNVTDGSYSLADPVNSTEYAYRNTPDSDKIMSFLSTTFNGYADGTEIIHVKAVSGEVAKVRVVWDREIYRQPMRISNKGKTYDITVGSNSYQGLDETYTLGGTYNATSFISFDTYNKLSIQNITPTSTTLKYGSNTYEIGTATNIYVENTGDYSAEIGNATDFALTNTTVSGTLKTVEPTLSGGYFFGHALTYDGKLYGWGENSSGQAGVGTSSDITVPTLCTGIPQGEVVSIWDQCVSSQNRWAKTRDGKIWVTGEGTQYSIPGQTGDQTSFIDVTSYFGDQSLTANNITQISGQGSRTTMALTETGNVWTWGTHSSSFWNLGQGTGASSSNTPKQITFGGVTDNISRVKLGGTHGVALDTDGDVWFWGQIWANGAGVDYPQATLSDAQKSPHEIMTSNNIIGVSSTYFTIYAWQSDGTYYALGQDSAGQIGDGTATAGGHTSWQKVDYFSANNITINEIYGGAYHVFADTSDGYYCWGGGTHGNLGNGSTGNLASPTKWTNVSNIKVFSSGSYECPYAITEDGKYYAWGNGTNNARGDNTTGDITYPKYIDTLPNILAPSFDYDGYDKVFVNNPYTQGQIVKFSKTTQTWPKQILITDVRIKDKNGNILPIEYIYFPLGNGGPNQDLEYIRPSDSLFSTVTDGSYSSVDSGALRNSPESNRLIHAPDSVYNTYPIGTEWMHVKAMSGSIVQVQIVWDRQQYIQPTKLDADGMTYDIPQGNQSTLAGQDSTYTLTGSYTSEKSSKYTKDTHTYDTKDTQIVTVSDPGTYDAQIKSGTNFNLKSATIPATKTSGLYTWAFHHGNFDNAYGDGDILTARDNGRFYADTPSYTGDIGTITAVNPLVSSNVSFRLNEYTQNDSSDTNTTGIMLTEIDVFDDTNTAMTYGTDYRADLYRAAYADNSGDGGTGKLSDETTPYNEDGSRLNDNVLERRIPSPPHQP
jgi:alpha-tubulin suppressor-like RCC1 family protein